MRLHKPDSLYASCQPFYERGEQFHCLSVSLGFWLSNGEIPPADQAWITALRELPSGMFLDPGLPKAQAEWLLAGQARIPATCREIRARVTVGSSCRRFLIRGQVSPEDRLVPLDWEHSFGATDKAGGKRPGAMVADPDAPPGPACPGARGAWPGLYDAYGRYDQLWLRTRWPGPPDDAHPLRHNRAQPAQWLPDGLAGAEKIELEGFVGCGGLVKTQVPRLRPRVRVRSRKADIFALETVADTLWLFPGPGLGMIFWRALFRGGDEAASHIAEIHLSLHEGAEETAIADPPMPRITLPDASLGARIADAASLRGMDLSGLDLRGLSLAGRDLRLAILDGSNLEGVDLTGVRADGASFVQCGLAESSWKGACCRAADFSRSGLERACMTGADFMGASFRESRCLGTDFSGSNLYGADLCRCLLDADSSWRGAMLGRTVLGAEGV